MATPTWSTSTGGLSQPVRWHYIYRKTQPNVAKYHQSHGWYGISYISKSHPNNKTQSGGLFEYNLDLPPIPSNSHHFQDYHILSRESRESQPKPLFATVTGWGVNLRYNGSLLVFSDARVQIWYSTRLHISKAEFREHHISMATREGKPGTKAVKFLVGY